MNESQTRRLTSGLATTLLAFATNVLPAQALTPDEEAALRQLCKVGLNANGGIWSAGMVQGLTHDVPTVKDLVDRMVAEAEDLIRGRLAGMVG